MKKNISQNIFVNFTKKVFKFSLVFFAVFTLLFVKDQYFGENNNPVFSVQAQSAEKINLDISFLSDDKFSKKEKIEKLKKIILEVKKRIEEILEKKSLEKNMALGGNAFDFYSQNPNLLAAVEREFSKLSLEEKAGMVLMTEFDKSSTLQKAKKQIQNLHIGGILTLSKNPDKKLLDKLESFNSQKLPLLFSADAESSLLKYRFPIFEKNNRDIGNTNDIKSVGKSQEIAGRIANMLYKNAYDINFAPVYDSAINKEVISDRAFSSENAVVQKLAGAFTVKTQEKKIFATAKHFPGHGNVKGDSHKMLPTIYGELIELENFQKAIDQEVVLIMVGHLAVENNSKWNTEKENGKSLPATLSKKIITNLLKEKMNFKGIIITDAMNMKGVSSMENAEIKALEAGLDIVLMPQNPEKTFIKIKNKMQNNQKFATIIEDKVKKIVKLKIISAWNRGEF